MKNWKWVSKFWERICFSWFFDRFMLVAVKWLIQFVLKIELSRISLWSCNWLKMGLENCFRFQLCASDFFHGFMIDENGWWRFAWHVYRRYFVKGVFNFFFAFLVVSIVVFTCLGLRITKMVCCTLLCWISEFRQFEMVCGIQLIVLFMWFDMGKA